MYYVNIKHFKLSYAMKVYVYLQSKLFNVSTFDMKFENKCI